MPIDNELRTLAEEAIVYAFPLYEMSRMRAATSPQRTDVAGEAPKPHRWCNVFTHARQLLGAGKSRVVTPNNDTLYTNAWLDLGDGPLVIDVPDTAGRYYVLGLLDFYTNPFAHIGQRLTGTAARSFLVTPPGWRGEVPAAFREAGSHVEAPTRWLWVIGRILVDGPQDVPAVNALQDGFIVRTLGDWQAGKTSSMPKHFDPACDPKAPLSAEHFATQVNRALRENPPPAREAGLIARFAALGLGPDVDALDDTQRSVLQDALDAVLPQLRGAQSGATSSTGWVQMPLVEGSFGDDHLARALVALKYIGMLESREATYPLAWNDASGRKLNGSGRYTLRFAPGALPPVEAFWSLTMYDSRDYMLVDNPIDRYAIGDRTPALRHDADGGLTLHIQHARPEDEAARANWLPAPAGDFYLCLRAYVPREEMLDGRYALPALVRTGEAA
ncbi:DUF1254 domain-containing protein [Variovorax sp. NFACC27]|uniref:DUF1254 domain-containing protein n=1 Tax=unclassified Variovorax TaxID=663243 RepID=UPI0008955381|nr:Uncharacterized conserved protein [Variovorax sp. NFACC28]SEG93819.1 Uncharacterized conserved protein [Variovorax sp. NFACC29]SFD59703.1 Uncharacterized conserved protein [Variovorax sp. NFACC26]SFG89601.1 Uncharacterized conserved protein [Variovorax sp. NFACC27]